MRHKEECEVVGGNGHAVDDVHGALEKVDLVGRACEPQQVLDAEVRDADGLNEGQLGVVHGLPMNILFLKRFRLMKFQSCGVLFLLRKKRSVVIDKSVPYGVNLISPFVV